MAQVYPVQQVLLNELQGLKFLSPEFSRDETRTTRFLREVRIMRLIRHKNVVQAGNLEPAEDGSVLSVAFSPLNDTVVSGSENMTIRLWEAAGVRP